MRKRNGTANGILVCAFGLLASSASAADFGVNGDGSNASVILEGKNINASASDKVGVQGYSVPAPFYGIGVRGYGGWKGVEASATISGAGSRLGVSATAGNGTSNYAVYASATGTGTNYGVYSYATGVNSRAGYFSGDLEYTGALVHTSDRKLKKNIVEIRNCTNVLKRMAPKEYEYRSDEYPTLHLPKTHQVGLIAQDVEAVLPDLVHESVLPPAPGDADKNAAGAAPETYKTVDYVALIPYLVGALQEQAYEIDALKKKLGGAK
jgi:hypothetical protein